jgi:predicted PurR-regulated permease PerM
VIGCGTLGAGKEPSIASLKPSFGGNWLKTSFPDRGTLNVVLTILLVAAVCVVIYTARRMIVIFVFAVLFAYLLDPVVKFLQRHSLFFRDLRGPAVIETYLAFLLMTVLVGYSFAPGIARNTIKLIDGIPVVLDGLSTGDIVTELGDKYGWSDKQEVRFQAFLKRHKDDIQSVVQIADRYLSHAAIVVLCLILIPILAIFLLRDGEHIADGLIRSIVPADSRQRVHAIAQELHLMLARYMRAQVLLCGLSLGFYSAVLLLFRFPHAIALAVLGGLLEFVPTAGWTSTAAVILTVGVVSHSHWGWMAALLVLWRLAMDYSIYPRILGREMEIHPLVAIFAVLVGAEVGGIIGIYLAVPIIDSMRVILRGMTAPSPSRRQDREAEPQAASNFRTAVAE